MYGAFWSDGGSDNGEFNINQFALFGGIIYCDVLSVDCLPPLFATGFPEAAHMAQFREIKAPIALAACGALLVPQALGTCVVLAAAVWWLCRKIGREVVV